MKTFKTIITASLLLAATATHAQNLYDAAQLSGSDLNGTARFVGMGGAMGALGGDITTMGTNPAGTGIYRSNDLNISFGFANVSNTAKLGNLQRDNDEIFGSLNNIGFVISMKQGNYTPVRYVNFGFNYRKLKSFDRNMVASGDYHASQTGQMALMSGGLSPDVLLSSNAFTYSDVPWLGALGYEAFLMEHRDRDLYAPYAPSGANDYITLGDYTARERGAIHSYDFNLSLNLQDRVYLGATLGVYGVDYTKTSTYSEAFEYMGDGGQWFSDGNYSLDTYYSLEGTGIDFKLGAIVRPFESSPLRIGLSIHTPTFYRLTARNSAELFFNDIEGLNDEGNYESMHGKSYTQDSYGNAMPAETEYRLQTPWKYNLSLGYTIGNNIALGAEYEYMDYSTSKLKDYQGTSMTGENKAIEGGLRGTSSVRLGVEYKPISEVSFRLGYNHITTPTYNDSYLEMPWNSVRTDTEFANRKGINNLTLGVGYRGSSFYADMAYQYSGYKEDFYAFDDIELPAIKIEHNRHQLMFTMGMRF